MQSQSKLPSLASLSEDAPIPPIPPRTQYTRVADVSAAIPVENKNGKWDSGILGCFDSYSCGPSCVLNHLFCQPCVVASSLANAKLPGSVFVGVTLAIGTGTCASIAGYYARRQVVGKYNISEGQITSFLAACCCLSLSNVQITGTVASNEGLEYSCASLNAPLNDRMNR